MNKADEQWRDEELGDEGHGRSHAGRPCDRYVYVDANNLPEGLGSRNEKCVVRCLLACFESESGESGRIRFGDQSRDTPLRPD